MRSVFLSVVAEAFPFELLFDDEEIKLELCFMAPNALKERLLERYVVELFEPEEHLRLDPLVET